MWACLDQGRFLGIVIYVAAWGPILRGFPKYRLHYRCVNSILYVISYIALSKCLVPPSA